MGNGPVVSNAITRHHLVFRDINMYSMISYLSLHIYLFLLQPMDHTGANCPQNEEFILLSWILCQET